jgi:hypothetical protein
MPPSRAHPSTGLSTLYRHARPTPVRPTETAPRTDSNPPSWLFGPYLARKCVISSDLVKILL